MAKKLIDRNDAFDIYYSLGSSRSLQMLLEHLKEKQPEHAPSLDTLKKWSSGYNWQERVLLMEQDVRDSLDKKMATDWAEIKAYFLKTLTEQVKLGRDAGVAPERTTDMVAAIKEARSMMGEGDKHDVTIQGIEYVPYQKKEEDKDT